MNQTTKILLWVIVILVIVVGGYLLGNQAPNNDAPSDEAMMEETTDEGPIKIGFIGPLTGDFAFVGQALKAATELAIEEINAAGKLGRAVEVVYEDGECDGGVAATNAANKLIETDNVVAIIGGACSGETLAVAPIAEAAGIPILSPASTAPDVSDAGDYVFRNVPSDNFQGAYMARLLKEEFGYETVATLSCLADWCQGVNNAFSKTFSELGGTIVAEEKYQRDDKDLSAQLTKIKSAEPDAVYFAGYTAETVLAFQQRAKLGLDSVPFIGADAWTDVIIWEQLEELGEGALYTEPANQDLPQSFLDGLSAKGQENNAYAIRAYDATYILASALEQTTDPEGIKDALYSVQDFEGVGDIYSFNEKGDIQNALYAVKRIVDGEPQEYTPDAPDAMEKEEDEG